MLGTISSTDATLAPPCYLPTQLRDYRRRAGLGQAWAAHGTVLCGPYKVGPQGWGANPNTARLVRPPVAETTGASASTWQDLTTSLGPLNENVYELYLPLPF